jgi:esterase
MEHMALLNAMLSADLSVASTRKDIENQLSSRIQSPRLMQFIMKNLYRTEKTRFAWRLNLPVLNEKLPLIMESIEPAGTFSKPSLFIRGGLSRYVKDEDIPGILKLFPAAVFKTIETAGHWIHADSPEEFLQILGEFFGDPQK